MKKSLSFLLSAILISGSVTALAASESDVKTTDGIAFETETAAKVPEQSKVTTFTLKENQSAVTLNFSEVSNPCNNFYISLYDLTDGEYILKQAGPITVKSFTLSGLKSGSKYRISLSAAVNPETVKGTVHIH